jgi:hypothetical protein
MKNSFLTKYDIVELLGLNLTSEEKERYLEELSDTCVKKAFYGLYREGKIEEELFNKIEPTILSDEKDYDITQEMGHLREEIDEAIILETNDYKKLSLLEQIEKFRHYTTKEGIQDIEIEETLTKLANSLNSNGENFDELLNTYKKLKIQYKYESKI